MKPKISIIIPYYNTNENLFKNCISSILEQTFDDYELLIINDGSDEKYRKILETIKQLDERIRIINKENNGVSSARNRGIEEALGEYITFIDADDIIANYFLEQAYTIITEFSVDFVIGAMKGLELTNSKEQIDIKSEKLEINHFTIYKKGQIQKLIPSLLAWNKMIRFPNGSFINRGPCSRLLKTSIVKQCLFQEGIILGEDMIWNQIVLKNCNSVAVVGNTWYYYVKNAESATHKYSPTAIDIIKIFHTALYATIDNTNDDIYTALCTKYLEDMYAVICHNYLTRKENKDNFFKKWNLFNQLKSQQPWTNITRRYVKLCNLKEKVLYYLFKSGLFFPLAYIKDMIKKYNYS